MALQPHRRARPRRFGPRRVVDGHLDAGARRPRSRSRAERRRSRSPGAGPAGVADLLAAERRLRRRPDVVIDVPAGRTVADPIVVRHRGAADGAAAFPRLVVRAGADAEVTVVERCSRGGAGLPGAHHRSWSPGRRGSVRRRPAPRPAAWSIGRLDIDADADATVTAGLAGVRRRLRRVRTDCRLVGRGATGDLLAAYFGDGDQTLDFRTFQDHAAPDTTSDLLFKGAVGDRQPLGVHGPHPGRQGRPRHQRLPDEPQHQAVRRRLGRVGAQPRDREQRRALQPRLGGRARSTRSSASTSRAAACPPGGRAAHRGRASSTRCSTAAGRRPAAAARRAPAAPSSSEVAP